MEQDAERIAYTQSLYRAANEAIQRAAQVREAPLTLICECGDETCRDTVELTREEYEDLRGHSRAFALVDGHEGDQEVVVHRLDAFTRVEKVGEAGEWAREHDPRREEES